MSPLFQRKPKLHTCLFCSELIADERAARHEHYRTHLIETTLNDGQKAFTFDCPRCGRSDEAVIAARDNEDQFWAVGAIYKHLLQRHNTDLITRRP